MWLFSSGGKKSLQGDTNLPSLFHFLPHRRELGRPRWPWSQPCTLRASLDLCWGLHIVQSMNGSRWLAWKMWKVVLNVSDRLLYKAFDHWVKSCGTFRETQEVHLNASSRCWYAARSSHHKIPVPNASLKKKTNKNVLGQFYGVIMCRQWETVSISSRYVIVIVQNISLSLRIHNLWTCASSQDRKRSECQCGTSSRRDGNPAVIQQGASGQEKVFKIKLWSKFNDYLQQTQWLLNHSWVM